MIQLLKRIFGGVSASDNANRLVTSYDLERWLYMGGGSMTRAGVAVTPEVALGVSAVSAAVGLLAETTAQIPLEVYRRRADGGKERATEHPLYALLHREPNGWQGSFDFREQMQLVLGLKGNAYAYVLRAGDGKILELLPLSPGAVEASQRNDWSLEYRVTLPDGTERLFDRRRILHIRDRSMDGVRGISRLDQAREAIGLAVKAESYGAQLFGNGARPSGILSTDQNLTDEQVKMIRESWQAAHGGENAMGTAVLDGNMKFQTLGFNPNDAQFIDLRKFQIGEVARIWRVPPHMLGDLERATFSNIEQQSLEFVKFSLLPWLRRWESAINTQLVEDDERDTIFAEFNVEGLLRGDFGTRVAGYSTGLRDGWLSVNEVRERENLSPIEGGDEYKTAESIFGAGMENNGIPDNEPQPSEADGNRA